MRKLVTEVEMEGYSRHGHWWVIHTKSQCRGFRENQMIRPRKQKYNRSRSRSRL